MARVPLDQEQESNPMKVATGAFAREAEIVEIEDFSNYPGQNELNVFESGWEPELCLKMVVNDGKREDKKFMVTGWFNRDKNTKEIKGWNTWKNAVHRFVMRIGGDIIEIEDSNWSIPKDILEKFIGRKFMFVRYITPETYKNDKGEDRPNYADWNMVFEEGTDLQDITNDFAENAGDLLSNKNPKYRYSPESVKDYSDSNDTSFDYGANAPDKDLDKPAEEDVI